jgi:hypothetical protein
MGASNEALLGFFSNGVTEGHRHRAITKPVDAFSRDPLAFPQ